MLEECRKKITRLGLADRASLAQGDFFEAVFPNNCYDSALVGFFLSHLTEAQERILFDRLRAMLRSDGQFLILDSAWTPERKKFNAKVEHQERRLNDGTTFAIYKRYCDQEEILTWSEKYGVTIRIEHFATAFYAVSGMFNL